MLFSRTRSVASSSVPEVWTCSSCRAKLQHQRRFQHNEAEVTFKHGTRINDTEAGHYLRRRTTTPHARVHVLRSRISQGTNTGALDSLPYGSRDNSVPRRQATLQTPVVDISRLRPHVALEDDHQVLYRHEQEDGEAPPRTNAIRESTSAGHRLPTRGRERPRLSRFRAVQLRRVTDEAHTTREYPWQARVQQHQSIASSRSHLRRKYSTVAPAETFAVSEGPPSNTSRDHVEPKGEKDAPGRIGIRDQLRKWQELYGQLPSPEDDIGVQETVAEEGLINMYSHLPSESSQRDTTRESDEHEAAAYFMQNSPEDAGDEPRISQHLLMGDLVEFEAGNTDTVSTVAVFIRKLDLGHKLGGELCQFLTVDGRWIHSREKAIMFAIPQFFPRDMIEPVVPYLPTEAAAEDLDALFAEAKLSDLSIPRDLSAPIVSKLQAFTNEAKEIYRKYATRLDDAHHILAHATDLRYGSLTTAASTLLKMSPKDLTPSALFAARQSLVHAGFAFEIDRRSHRITGYLQIRSKEQVKMLENVRDWMRDWQEDQSLRATMNDRQLRRHSPSEGAQIIYTFVEKARRIVLENRKSRQPTVCNNVGPSSKKIVASVHGDCVQMDTTNEFGHEEMQILKFMEVWSVTQQLRGYGRITALPPLLLQATGVYGPEWRLSQWTGFQFLQELGTILPYENRNRFDQHLLLPSSQHSKPLRLLAMTLADMKSRPDFEDSMAGLRKDWKDLPVYCIDGAGAQEIDDGISVELAGKDKDGIDTHWIRVHIANPTAFFSRDHPLAKMARHMGETIYFPERTYMMLPPWVTQGHFSLTSNRPCLTFSARLDHKGQTLETKIESGTIRNVISLTGDELNSLLGLEAVKSREGRICLTVGGELPPPKARKSAIASLTAEHKQQLQTLYQLSLKRTALRRQNGSFIFEGPQLDVNVWQNLRGEGLAWDNPYRQGRRTVYGDPGIQIRNRAFKNIFDATTADGENTVRESMLLAGEIAANWCAERRIPGIFRGSVSKPGEEGEQERMLKETIEPLWQSGGLPRGEFSMHMGMRYLRTYGETRLSTRPFKHRVLGMDAYGKMTSPLRRYGDMIMHWQIEAALREEARRGQSLITQDPDEPRPFLPFSAAVLENIFVGLQPREILIQRSSYTSQLHWAMLLLMRAYHYNEIPLPLEKPGHTKVYLQATNPFLKSKWVLAPATSMELNLPCYIKPSLDGVVQGPFRQGDVWEVRINEVDVFLRGIIGEPVRLLERVD